MVPAWNDIFKTPKVPIFGTWVPKIGTLDPHLRKNVGVGHKQTFYEYWYVTYDSVMTSSRYVYQLTC